MGGESILPHNNGRPLQFADWRRPRFARRCTSRHSKHCKGERGFKGDVSLRSAPSFLVLSLFPLLYSLCGDDFFRPRRSIHMCEVRPTTFDNLLLLVEIVSGVDSERMLSHDKLRTR